MAISKVGICNSALIKIGADRISTITDDVKAAILCNEQWDKLRDEVLMAHPWNFAIKRATLATVAEEPEFEFDYVFQKPADCLRILNLNESYIKWKVEADKVLTDADEVSCRYIAQIVDVTKFTAQFAEVLAFRLAAELAYPIANSTALAETMMKAYENQLRLARTFDAQEGSPDEVEADDWINSRW